MNFLDVVAMFGTGTYVVTRRAPTVAGTDGLAVPASSSTFNVQGSLMPTGGRELQRDPQGLRTVETRTFYSGALLQVTGAPDIVSIDGVDWEVESSQDFSVLGMFYIYTLRRAAN